MFTRVAAGMIDYGEIRDLGGSHSKFSGDNRMSEQKVAKVYSENSSPQKTSCDLGGIAQEQKVSIDTPTDRTNEIHPSGQISSIKNAEALIHGATGVINGVWAGVDASKRNVEGFVEHGISMAQEFIDANDCYKVAKELKQYETQAKTKNDVSEQQRLSKVEKRTEGDRRAIEDNESNFITSDSCRNDDHGFIDRSCGMDRW